MQETEIIFDEVNGDLLLIGSKYKNSQEIETDHNLVGGYHFGHQITEIIK